jgi:hypothetical protein
MATSRLCSIPDCGKPHYAHGWCRNHYRRFTEHGDPLAGGTPRGVAIQWLFDHKTYVGNDCLVWPFGHGSKGYGAVRFGRPMGAHRAMCLIAHGEPPTEMHEAAHSCGKGSSGCVHPKHLRWATTQENSKDAAMHGSLKGENQSRAKLTTAQVRSIRALHGQYSRRVIGQMFGVSGEAIASIHLRRSWAWLP